MATYPIVGAHFRPPAKTILEILGVGTPLILRAEPDNAYDANAIQVLIRGTNVPAVDGIDAALAGYGTTIAEINAQDEIHLGYIPREMAAELTAAGFPASRDIEGTFSVSAGGAARVRFDAGGW